MEKHIQDSRNGRITVKICGRLWQGEMKITAHFTPFTSIKWPESLLETVDVVDQHVTMNGEKEQWTMGKVW